MLRLIFKIAAILTSLIQALIIFRIVLGVFSANMENTYVQWVFTMTDLFISPFEGITASSLMIDRFEIILTPFVALIFYSIVGFVLSELLKTLRRD
jgi:uncharacterized protein YggT (Ycf19 family)